MTRRLAGVGIAAVLCLIPMGSGAARSASAASDDSSDDSSTSDDSNSGAARDGNSSDDSSTTSGSSSDDSSAGGGSSGDDSSSSGDDSSSGSGSSTSGNSTPDVYTCKSDADCKSQSGYDMTCLHGQCALGTKTQLTPLEVAQDARATWLKAALPPLRKFRDALKDGKTPDASTLAAVEDWLCTPKKDCTFTGDQADQMVKALEGNLASTPRASPPILRLRRSRAEASPATRRASSI
jgi:hypothetical protein